MKFYLIWWHAVLNGGPHLRIYWCGVVAMSFACETWNDGQVYFWTYGNIKTLISRILSWAWVGYNKTRVERNITWGEIFKISVWSLVNEEEDMRSAF